MKISIGSRIINGPWGGGNLFVLNLKNYLIKNGHEVIHDLCDKEIDIILLTDPRSRKESSSTFNQINQNTKYYQRKKKYLSFLSKNKKKEYEEITVQVNPLSYFEEFKMLDRVDILKIDTEGYELKVLKGIKKEDIEKIRFIYFEHHYDLMIKKNYKYFEIKNFLNQNNFHLKLKLKMNFRKTFEYIYEKVE